jgi:hypothetical protein
MLYNPGAIFILVQQHHANAGAFRRIPVVRSIASVLKRKRAIREDIQVRAKKDELKAIFKDLKTLDLKEFLDGCVNGFKKDYLLTEGIRRLAEIMAREYGLGVTLLADERKNVVSQKSALLFLLGCVQEGCLRHPEFWKNDSCSMGFSGLLREVKRTYNKLARVLTAKEALSTRRKTVENALIELRESNYPVWCCIEGFFEKMGMAPKYPDAPMPGFAGPRVLS